jgi:hypothetical protein
MERCHTPLSVWLSAAYLVASQTPGMSAVQFQRQLGLTRYEIAFGILHKLRVGMLRPDKDVAGRKSILGSTTHGSAEGCAAKVGASKRWRPPLSRFATASRARQKDKRKDGRYAGLVRLAIAAAPIRCEALSRMPSCQAR